MKRQDPDDRLSYRDLTPRDRELICNGCGGKGSWINPPDWLFRASCDWHDFEYWRGGTEKDRLAADRGFYRAMVEDTARRSWWLRPLARLRAWLYYRAVRLFAKPYFHYGRPRGRRMLTMERAAAGDR